MRQRRRFTAAAASLSAGVVLANVALSACSNPQSAGKATDAVDAAEAFIALAGGDDAAEVPWAEQVVYLVGGVEIGALRPDALPAALSACPPGVSEYEGRTCPVSPLATVGRLLWAGDAAVVEQGAPEVVGCTRVSGPAPGARLTVVSIRPPADARDCFSDFAVTLFVQPAGAVERIDFTLSGP